MRYVEIGYCNNCKLKIRIDKLWDNFIIKSFNFL